jgi:hypothetical protein
MSETISARKEAAMMILVHVPTERPIRPVLDASISLAATVSAHVDAVAIGYISVACVPQATTAWIKSYPSLQRFGQKQ